MAAVHRDEKRGTTLRNGSCRTAPTLRVIDIASRWRQDYRLHMQPAAFARPKAENGYRSDGWASPHFGLAKPTVARRRQHSECAGFGWCGRRTLRKHVAQQATGITRCPNRLSRRRRPVRNGPGGRPCRHSRAASRSPSPEHRISRALNRDVPPRIETSMKPSRRSGPPIPDRR